MPWAMVKKILLICRLLHTYDNLTEPFTDPTPINSRLGFQKNKITNEKFTCTYNFISFNLFYSPPIPIISNPPQTLEHGREEITITASWKRSHLDNSAEDTNITDVGIQRHQCYKTLLSRRYPHLLRRSWRLQKGVLPHPNNCKTYKSPNQSPPVFTRELGSEQFGGVQKKNSLVSILNSGIYRRHREG